MIWYRVIPVFISWAILFDGTNSAPPNQALSSSVSVRKTGFTIVNNAYINKSKNPVIQSSVPLTNQYTLELPSPAGEAGPSFSPQPGQFFTSHQDSGNPAAGVPIKESSEPTGYNNYGNGNTKETDTYSIRPLSSTIRPPIKPPRPSIRPPAYLPPPPGLPQEPADISTAVLGSLGGKRK